ncbi:MAG: flagellar biosynthesis protein [Armatimonadetes bacterium]|nr:flagellar biosynthesis protein [Armatimonadota bacterium]
MSDNISNPAIQNLVTGRIQPGQIGPATPANKPSSPDDFSKILEDRLKVSGHAATRLSSRNIELSSQDWDRVVQGVERAASKGAKESLVLMDDVALVVSVKNRTVITAVDKAGMKENVFTNIDSAVVV